MNAGWNFDNSYARLPGLLHRAVDPAPVRAPRLVLFNRALAAQLGLNPDALSGEEGAAVFAGNTLPPGSQPIAQAYAGHQFGHFAMLGDGRAILLGEQLTPTGQRYDIQLKGSGRTAFSRMGDGRAALGPMLREYIISEAMHGLGIPTTRSLAVVATGEDVQREENLPGAVLTRVAASHIRVGTFQFLAAHGDTDALRALADYTLGRHYPELAEAPAPYLSLLQAVMDRQAALVARWLHVGFIHGVMNTDNMALSGETIDYGPCAFLDTYDPDTAFSSIDQHGRYAYGNQPQIAQWNLARLAETLLPLLHTDKTKAIALAEGLLQTFAETFRAHWLDGMRAKLGLFTRESGDQELATGLLTCLKNARADYTATFRDLARPDAPALLADSAFQDWRQRWQARLDRQPQTRQQVHELMLRHNPAVIARNAHVEHALDAATQTGDLGPLHRLLAALANPCQEGLEQEPYRTPPAPMPGYRTFCGT